MQMLRFYDDGEVHALREFEAGLYPQLPRYWLRRSPDALVVRVEARAAPANLATVDAA